LQTLTPPSAFTTGNFGFSYDALSRRTQLMRPNSVTTNYAYDNLSRLTSVLHQLSGSTFKYDPFGRRIYKSSSTATSIYAYEGDNVIEETNSSGAVVARYSQKFGIDG
jgi:YD repeat-containing protein